MKKNKILLILGIVFIIGGIILAINSQSFDAFSGIIIALFGFVTLMIFLFQYIENIINKNKNNL